MVKIENIIAALRAKEGLTQAQLADKIGVSRQTIISLEGGRYNPSIYLAHKIAEVFSKTIEDVFIFKEDE